MSKSAGHSQVKKIFAFTVRKKTPTAIKVEFWADGGNFTAEFLLKNSEIIIEEIEIAIANEELCMNYLGRTYRIASNLLQDLKEEISSYMRERVNDANNSGAYPNGKETPKRAEASVQDNSISARQISKEKHFNEERRIKNEELNTTQALDIVRIANETNSNTSETIRFEHSKNLNFSFFVFRSSLKTKHKRSTLVASVIQS